MHAIMHVMTLGGALLEVTKQALVSICKKQLDSCCIEDEAV